jgi:DNA-binding MarR family transcriptional regulator
MEFPKEKINEQDKNLTFLQSDSTASLIKSLWLSYSRMLQMGLMEHSVSFGHWTFLRILWEKEGLTQKNISTLAKVSEPTTHTALKMMVKLGYIERRKALNNKKNIYIYLTKNGRELQNKLLPLAYDINSASLVGISKDDIEVTRRTLNEISKNLQTLENQSADQNKKLPSTRELTNRFNSTNIKVDKK